MSPTYLHGAEVIELFNGPTPIRVAKTAVIGIVGTAPIGAVNQPIVLYSENDHAQFGSEVEGFTIPQALKAVRDFGAGTVIVINVLDPATHKDSVEGEPVAFNANTGKAQLSKGAIANLVLSDGASTTYVLGTDYVIVDPVKGIIQRLSTGNIPTTPGTVAAFDFADPTAIIAADVIGETDIAGQRSGFQALRNTYSIFGLKAKILISPVYSTQNAIRAEMDVLAHELDAIALADAPIGTTPQQAITGRGPSGAINFNTSSGRTILLYPYLKVYDAATDSERLEPYSQRFAALMCANDYENGYWFSPSNQEIKGIVGVERPITGGYGEPDSEANALNEVGITTVINAFGSGIRAWGNRTAAWPSETHPINFLPVRRTADVIKESLIMASAKYVDKPGGQPQIDDVVASGNAFMRDLIQRGAILDGRVWFDPQKNSAAQMALGNYVYCYDFMPPTPMERITWEAHINQNYLTELAQRIASSAGN
jgi:uncharacterized protein